MSAVRELLLAPRLAPGRVEALLRPYLFRDPLQADRELQRMAEDPSARLLLAPLLDDLLMAAADSADPDAALNRLERFVRASGSAARLFSHLAVDRRLVEVLARTLGASTFLAEILIRQPEWFSWLSEPEVLSGRRSGDEIWVELRNALLPLRTSERRLDVLRIVKRREILRIGVRDLLRLSSVEETLGALSGLADALIEGALFAAEADLRESCGLPPPSPTPGRPGFVVLGMGKLGGGELNFSSDVDLVYVHEPEPASFRRGRREPRGGFGEALARRLTAALSEVTGEGYVYRVDLRLRPEGGAGSASLPVRAFAGYYRKRGAPWERLALLKARPVAGDRELGAACLQKTRPFVFGRGFGPREVAEVRRIKAQVDARVAGRGESARHVKLGTGGIREIELAAQVLQARFGRGDPALRVRGTLAALHALGESAHLAPDEVRALTQAYTFLRDLENKLQMVADTQTHLIPNDPEEVRRCALRLGHRDRQGIAAGEALLEEYGRHTTAVRRIFARVVGD